MIDRRLFENVDWVLIGLLVLNSAFWLSTAPLIISPAIITGNSSFFSAEASSLCSFC
jgi:hypothetical protein